MHLHPAPACDHRVSSTAAPGEPGPGGYGVYIVDDRARCSPSCTARSAIATNNIAEYHGLIAALQWAVDHDVTEIAIKGDSLLIIEQMRGNYKVKNEGLKPLHMQARMLVMQIGDVKFAHVPPRAEQGRRSPSNVGMDGNG